MGRKTKTGLDSFKISVDLLDDERIVILGSKFGCKVEGILLRLYSMIYKNGYYIEITDAVISKIAKSVNSNYDETKEIIVSLIDNGFFDTNLVENNILTSSEIQLQYFGSVTRRVLKSPDNYQYILDEVKEIIYVNINAHLCKQKSTFMSTEIDVSVSRNNLCQQKSTFMSTEIPISVSRNTDLCQHKRNSLSLSLSQINNINNLESKDNIKEENKEESFGVISVHSIDGLKTIMLASPIWKNDIRMYISRLTGRILSDQQIDDYIDTFSMKLKSEGETEKTEDDAKRHFTNWLRIELTKPSKSKPRFGREKVEDKVFEQF